MSRNNSKAIKLASEGGDILLHNEGTDGESTSAKQNGKKIAIYHRVTWRAIVSNGRKR